MIPGSFHILYDDRRPVKNRQEATRTLWSEIMNISEWSERARQAMGPGTGLFDRHMDIMREMVRIDSRSFNVNEFPGDRTEPSDMQDILKLAEIYLRDIGFSNIRINLSPDGSRPAFPILMAELMSGDTKPTLLMYAHLDKQPYMDDHRFIKWDGFPPTELRWNRDQSRAYGRGAADDLSGVVAIGMAVDAVLQSIGFDSTNPSPEILEALPCNIKIIFETEEESGSHSLIDQILQNKPFFQDADCVIITDVTNPEAGQPGLTTSLRGIVQVNTTARKTDPSVALDAQTALYKTLATLVHDDHSLAVQAIRDRDIPVTTEEHNGYTLIPLSVDMQRHLAGLLPKTRLTVAEDKADIIQAQLRTSYANVRPGHRVAGGVVFGAAGARIFFHLNGKLDREEFINAINATLQTLNPFQLKLRVQEAPEQTENSLALDVVVQSATKDPHSGVSGGPFPVPELQLARMVDTLIDTHGRLAPASLQKFMQPDGPITALSTQALHAEHNGTAHPFEDSTAKALVEVRLAPGNSEDAAGEETKAHLQKHVPAGFDLQFDNDKGGAPWITSIEHPAFGLMLESLKAGYGVEPCIFGCGGSIPFVAKLMDALGNLPPLCIAPYDQDCRMHEPGESLSVADLVGCARSVAHFMLHSPKAFPKQ